MPQKVEVSHRTIVFTVFFLVALFLIYQLRQVFLLLFISLILMSALNPTVVKLESLRIPRVLAIFLIYFLMILVLGLSLASIAPALVEQTGSLINRLPEYMASLQLPEIDDQVISSQINQLGSIPANLLKIIMSVFSNLAGFLIVAVITFYLLLERKNLDHYLKFLFDGNGRDKVYSFVDKLEFQMGGWVRAQITLMVIVGLMTYFGLRLLGIEFALPLAILAGFLEIVPNLGPTLAAVPAILAGLMISPLTALAVVALAFLIQQLENSLIVPQIMAKGVGIKPLFVLVFLAIGVKLGGLLGAILAIPFMILIRVIISEFFSADRKSNLA